MDAVQEQQWGAIRITPQKWKLHPWGDAGGKFWVIAVLGKMVIWYNDIEDGFISSMAANRGITAISDALEWQIQQILNLLESGYDNGPFARPPVPLAQND